MSNHFSSGGVSLLEDVEMLVKKIYKKHSLKVPESFFRAVTQIDPTWFL